MNDFEEIEQYVKSRLTEKRYIHSVKVMERCIEFAEIYNVDIEKAKRVRYIS